MIVSLTDKQIIHHVSIDQYRGYALTSYWVTSSWICEASKPHRAALRSEAGDLTIAIQMTKHKVDIALCERAGLRERTGPSRAEIMAALTDLRCSSEPPISAVLEVLAKSPNAKIDVSLIKSVAGCASITEIYLLFAQLGRALCDELNFAPISAVAERDPYLDFVMKPEIHYYNRGNTIKLELNEQFFHALRDS